MDCEKFTNETITAIKTATMEQFRQRYRKADVLLIDDIQFLAGTAPVLAALPCPSWPYCAKRAVHPILP